MDILKLKFENCYGLKKFEHVFDFTKGAAQVIYAPNGAMKSSFAKVFDDISNGTLSKDRVFKTRVPGIVISCNDDNTELPKEKIFVIEPYKEELRYERISTLLVNKELKDEYNAILKEINDKKDHLVKNLQKHSGLRNNLIQEFTATYKKTEKELLDCLNALSAEVNDDAESLFPNVAYKEIFNDKVVTFLNSSDFKSKLDEYLDTYDSLISKSTYFKKGVFTHNNADTVSKSLKDNGFFVAAHTVSFNSQEGKKELATQEALDGEIQSEKNKILTDETLSQKFQAMDSAMNKNAELKSFRSFLENNPQMRQELRDLDALKHKLWMSYLKTENIIFNELIGLYTKGKIEIARIVEQARKEQSDWKKIVTDFNSRFKVPYKILIKNQDEIILNNAAPSIVFEYHDGAEKEEIGGAALVDILSTGERRALYLLNILFEIENRKKSDFRSLIIIDDIADSFDYRNKYAIVEYLKDMIESEKFRMIILTHNFDFYRTAISRLNINKWTNCFLSIKTESDVKLVKGKDSIEIFTDIKSQYHNNTAKLITAIPFVRNLIDYTAGKSTNHYSTLTALLHFKSEKGIAPDIIKGTKDISILDLQTIFDDTFRTTVSIPNPGKSVFELIIESADSLCLIEEERSNIEDKIVLSIAIRLKAEVFMVNKINDTVFVDGISSNQTAKLIKKYCQLFPAETNNISVLNRVNVMTPENIHLNSFMYEPILDLSDHHLKTLYKDVIALH